MPVKTVVAVRLIAHPGRDEGYTCYDAHLLDELRRHVPIDGFEAQLLVGVPRLHQV